MSTAETKTVYTPEDLLNMPDDGVSYELVDGQLVEKPVSVLSGLVGGILFGLLASHCLANRLGLVWPADTSFQCFSDAPNKVRKPDTAFIRHARITQEHVLTEGHCPVAPDLAVEVVSPNEEVYELDQKVQEYLNAGVRLVWVVNPDVRTVHVYRADGTTALLKEKDELDGEDVVPGFRVPVRGIFPSPEMLGSTS